MRIIQDRFMNRMRIDVGYYAKIIAIFHIENHILESNKHIHIN